MKMKIIILKNAIKKVDSEFFYLFKQTRLTALTAKMKHDFLNKKKFKLPPKGSKG